MRKEEIRGLIIYSILILAAVIVGLTVIRDSMANYGPNKMSDFGFIIIVLLIAYLFNAFGLEFLHVLGAIIGGYSVTSFNVLSLCFYKTEEKWKFGFRDFNGICGETKIAPKKEKTNINMFTWLPLFGFAIELAACVVISTIVKTNTLPKHPWLRSAAIIFILISSMIAFYNLVPFKLDAMTDGFRIRLFTKEINVKAYNEMLVVKEEQRIGKSTGKIPVFDEITDFTAEINILAMYQFLESENYDEARNILDKLIDNKKVLNIDDYNRLLAQKIYLEILTKPIDEARKLYDELCSADIRRFIANDSSMQSIRAYVLIAGMIEGSESEVEYAKSKVERAKKRTLASQIATEEKLLTKALDYVYENHPKWVKEKAAE